VQLKGPYQGRGDALDTLLLGSAVAGLARQPGILAHRSAPTVESRVAAGDERSELALDATVGRGKSLSCLIFSNSPSLHPKGEEPQTTTLEPVWRSGDDRGGDDHGNPCSWMIASVP
jgi:hypothetical protein